MTRAARLLWLGACSQCAVLCACTIDGALGAPSPQQQGTTQVADGGASEPKTSADAGGPHSAGHQHNRAARDVARGDSLIGLTRAEVTARRGPPIEQDGNKWVYTHKQAGCREAITGEVVTFKGDVVTKVGLQREQTGTICGRGPPRER